jgi:hypothetical protein
LLRQIRGEPALRATVAAIGREEPVADVAIERQALAPVLKAANVGKKTGPPSPVLRCVPRWECRQSDLLALPRTELGQHDPYGPELVSEPGDLLAVNRLPTGDHGKSSCEGVLFSLLSV